MSANPGGTQRTAAASVNASQARVGDAPPGAEAPAAATDRSWRSGASGSRWFPRAGWLVVLIGVSAVLAACRTHYQKQAATVDPQTAVDFRPGWQVGKRYLQRYETTTELEVSKSGPSQLSGPHNSHAMDVGVSVLAKLSTGGFDVDVEIVRFRATHAMGPMGSFVFDSDRDPVTDSSNPHNALYRRLGGARIRCVTDRHGRIKRLTLGRELHAFVNSVRPSGGEGILQTLLAAESFSNVLSLVGALPEGPLKPGESWSAMHVQHDSPLFLMSPRGNLRIDQTNTVAGFENHEGRHCAIVRVAGTISPEGFNSGHPSSVRVVKGTTTGNFWFDLRRGVFTEAAVTRELARESNRDGPSRISGVTTQISRLKLLAVTELSAQEFAGLVPTFVPTDPAAKTAPTRAIALPGDTVLLRRNWAVGSRFLHRMEIQRENEVILPVPPRPLKQEIFLHQECVVRVREKQPDGRSELEVQFGTQKFQFPTFDGRGQFASFEAKPEANNDRDNPGVVALQSLANVNFRYLMDAYGGFVRVAGLWELWTSLSPGATPLAFNIFHTILSDDHLQQVVAIAPDFPDHPVKVGDTWPSHRFLSIDPWGMRAAARFFQGSLTNTFLAWEQHDQRRCVVIEFSGTITTNPAHPAGKTITVEDGRIAGRVWFDPASGTVVDSVCEQELKVTSPFGGRNGTTKMKTKVGVKVLEMTDIPPTN